MSWGIGCASKHFPGVYARVSEGFDFIKKEVCENSVDPPASFDCDGTGGGGNTGGGGGNGGGGNGGGGNGGGGNTGGGGSNTGGVGSATAPTEGGNTGGGNTGGGNTGGVGSNPGDWTIVLKEDFKYGYGYFQDNDENRLVYELKGKYGVARIQRKGKLGTNAINVRRYSQCQALVTFLTIGMEPNDEWCVEYSEGKNKGYFKTAKCFNSAGALNNKRWFNQVASFSVNGDEDVYLRIQIQGDSRKDDLLIAGVTLQCQ